MCLVEVLQNVINNRKRGGGGVITIFLFFPNTYYLFVFHQAQKTQLQQTGHRGPE